MLSSTPILALLSAATLSSAHTVITYPGWRGDNLITNDTFPYGMQWMYPCEFAFPFHNQIPRSTETLTTTPRRRPPDHHKQDLLVHQRRRRGPPARLVPGPPDGLHVHQPGLRHRRPRRRPREPELPHGLALPDHRPQREPLPGHHLPPRGAPARQHDGEGRRQRHHPGSRDREARCLPVLRKKPPPLPPQKTPSNFR